MFKLRNTLAALALASTATLSPLTAAPITIGSGPDSSFLVIESSGFSDTSLLYEVRYTYSPMETFDSFDLLQIVQSADPLISFALINYGSAGAPNYYLNSITYNSVTFTNTAWPDTGPYWAHSVSGGEAGYPTAEPIATGIWTSGSGISDPYRLIQPGSWDGFVFSEGDAPGIAPVPEPGTVVLFGLGFGLILLTLRRRAA